MSRKRRILGVIVVALLAALATMPLLQSQGAGGTFGRGKQLSGDLTVLVQVP